jgi:hypothetical protein
MIAPYKHNTSSLAGAEKHLLSMSLMKEGGAGGVREGGMKMHQDSVISYY